MRNFNIKGKIWFLRVIIFLAEQSYSYLFEKYVIAVFRYDPVHQAVLITSSCRRPRLVFLITTSLGGLRSFRRILELAKYFVSKRKN